MLLLDIDCCSEAIDFSFKNNNSLVLDFVLLSPWLKLGDRDLLSLNHCFQLLDPLASKLEFGVLVVDGDVLLNDPGVESFALSVLLADVLLGFGVFAGPVGDDDIFVGELSDLFLEGELVGLVLGKQVDESVVLLGESVLILKEPIVLALEDIVLLNNWSEFGSEVGINLALGGKKSSVDVSFDRNCTSTTFEAFNQPLELASVNV